MESPFGLIISISVLIEGKKRYEHAIPRASLCLSPNYTHVCSFTFTKSHPSIYWEFLDSISASFYILSLQFEGFISNYCLLKFINWGIFDLIFDVVDGALSL